MKNLTKTQNIMDLFQLGVMSIIMINRKKKRVLKIIKKRKKKRVLKIIRKRKKKRVLKIIRKRKKNLLKMK